MGIASAITNSINSVENQSSTPSMPVGILQAIKNAAVRTGVDFSYLVKKAAQESGFNATAQAATSSATGLYQFTNQTWLQMVKRNGAQYGLGSYAAQITTDSTGHLSVSDPTTRQAILALRNDPQISAEMAGELDKQNAASLQSTVGGTITGTDLYLAHFLGAGGASDFLSTMQTTPNATGVSVLPEAAAANPSVFYNKDGTARSLQQIYQHFAQKFEAPVSSALQLASATSTTTPASTATAASTSTGNTTALVSQILTANVSASPHIHSLYSTTADATPVSSGLRATTGAGAINLTGSSTMFAAMILGQMNGVASASSKEALEQSGNRQKDAISVLADIA